MKRRRRVPVGDGLREELAAFREFGTATAISSTLVDGFEVPTYTNEFWTATQRAAHSLHEVSYRACFKPQLPRFFIERLTRDDDVVYDPFMGRGTTVLEAALLGRRAIGCDINPLSGMLVEPRLDPPDINAVAARLEEIMRPHHVRRTRGVRPTKSLQRASQQLLVFYHPDTLAQILTLKSWIRRRSHNGRLDSVDRWIRMVALNRLTGHSPGFFSVYTLPPNQAVSLASQRKINAHRNQTPPARDVTAIILKKSRSLLKDLSDAERWTLVLKAPSSRLLTAAADKTAAIAAHSVRLIVTSPPFLNVVDYATDNWLRCWFAGIHPGSVKLTSPHKLTDWAAAMTQVFRELARVLAPGGWIAFEVGEICKGKIKLEETVIPCGAKAGLVPELVLINSQTFTKTSHAWGVDNLAKGTNTNRVVVFHKP